MNLAPTFWDGPTCIDHSEAGSWAKVLPYCTQIKQVSADEYDLERRLAKRKAARLNPNPWKRGHITRGINREAGL